MREVAVEIENRVRFGQHLGKTVDEIEFLEGAEGLFGDVLEPAFEIPRFPGGHVIDHDASLMVRGTLTCGGLRASGRLLRPF